jgi:hypothetical protein
MIAVTTMHGYNDPHTVMATGWEDGIWIRDNSYNNFVEIGVVVGEGQVEASCFRRDILNGGELREIDNGSTMLSTSDGVMKFFNFYNGMIGTS